MKTKEATDELIVENLTTAQAEFEINGQLFSSERLVIAAGPCAVEDFETTLRIAKSIRAGGGRMLRGGAYKPRTSPHSFQGLKEAGLEILRECSRRTGLPVVTEVMDPRLVDKVSQYADVLQIGSRNMQNFPLLTEVGRCGKPVLLKRGMAATVEEFLCAAEYVVNEGNTKVILCERGIRTFEVCTRATLDLASLRVIKSRTALPVWVDPSHAAGDARFVPHLALAAVAAGADGLLIEVHTDPPASRCDAHQALHTDQFAPLVRQLAQVRDICSR